MGATLALATQGLDNLLPTPQHESDGLAHIGFARGGVQIAGIGRGRTETNGNATISVKQGRCFDIALTQIGQRCERFNQAIDGGGAAAQAMASNR